MNSGPAPFRLYNTLSRTVEPFVSLEPGKVKLYVCGMTVYDEAHVGHARVYIIFDAFVRYLRAQGWDVTYVRNFTDVDDKIIRRANEKGVPPLELAQHYIDCFHRDMTALGLLDPEFEPRVSTSMDAILEMIGRLVSTENAYASGGSVWFDVTSKPDYGKLSGQKIDDLRSADAGESHKRHPADFALWKAVKPGEPSWESPWGPGRPGWHIECSAMNMDTQGPSIDIHGGGLDLVFPHHENEIAQSECANHAPYARYWMHNGLLTVPPAEGSAAESAKMGKSLGNAFRIHDALQSVPAEAMRLFYLQAHYRSALPWTPASLTDALALLARLYEAREVARAMGGDDPAERVISDLGADAKEVYDLGQSFSARFHEALQDDFNTAAAMAHAYELARAINRFANHKKAKKRGAPVVAPALAGLEELRALNFLTQDTEAFFAEVKRKRLKVMGLTVETIEGLLADRKRARTERNWSEADAIRDKLDEMGIVVMDGAEGVTWRVAL